MSHRLGRKFLPKHYEAIVRPTSDDDDEGTGPDGIPEFDEDDGSECQALLMATPSRPIAQVDKIAKPSKEDLATAGSSSGEPFQKYQNRKGRKSAEKKATRVVQAKAVKHAKHLKTLPAKSSGRPRTRSQDRKSDDKTSHGSQL